MIRFRFKTTGRGLETVLGPLERQIMEQVWILEKATVQAVCDTLDGELAYTTVKTVMDRLEEKGMLKRVKQGRPVVYAAAITEAELGSQAARSVLESLFGQMGKSAMTQFAEMLRENPARLKELRSLLKDLPDDAPGVFVLCCALASLFATYCSNI
jgi:BlaI family transcriptional regulator, penicillinase repressor